MSEARFVFYHGNKNYSSWSMRGWLSLRLSGAEFEEVAFHLGQPGIRDEIRQVSPSGRVPALHHGHLVLWDSLAIAEYLAERFPQQAMWPKDAEARAVARCVVAEMHSGFGALRERMPFNVRRSSPGKGQGPDVARDIARIAEIWSNCRARFGQEGPFLFGDYTLADITYAPVVSRFRTYEVEQDEVSREYARAVWAHPHVLQWCEAAVAETWTEPQYDR